MAAEGGVAVGGGGEEEEQEMKEDKVEEEMGDGVADEDSGTRLGAKAVAVKATQTMLVEEEEEH